MLLSAQQDELVQASRHTQDRTLAALDRCDRNVSEAEGDPAGDNEPDGPVTLLTKVETMLPLAAGAKLKLRDDDGTRRSLTGKLSDMEAGDDQGAARQMSFMSDSDHSDMAMDDILVPEHQPPELSHIMTGPSMRSLGRTLQMVPAAPEESYDT